MKSMIGSIGKLIHVIPNQKKKNQLLKLEKNMLERKPTKKSVKKMNIMRLENMKEEDIELRNLMKLKRSLNANLLIITKMRIGLMKCSVMLTHEQKQIAIKMSEEV